ncbi:MAG: hypothetical protein IJA95_07190 [Bacteroidaceae bacterium]|nr:hypothetical protein [Bacteroidaceae bacterium]
MNETKHYTAEEIHMAMTLQAVEYMKQYMHSATDPKVEERARKLKAVGLTNSKTFAETHRSACFSFFRRNFPSCIFLPEDTFIRLLQKYNLKCGTLDHYIGEIPSVNVDEIAEVQEKLNSIGEENVFSNTLEGDAKVEIIKHLTEVFFREVNKTKTVRDLLNDRQGLIETMPFLHIRHQFDGYLDIETESRPLERNELLIAAPAQEMKQVYTESIEHVRSEDPFVFQFTPYGVVIFSKWGEEAEDEALSNEIIW